MRTERQTSAGGVVVRTGPGGPEILLASRRTRKGELVWGLPKGMVEKGEQPEDAALREVREETGYTATIREPLDDVSYWFVWDGTRVRKTVHFFLMRAVGGDPERHDHEFDEVRWVPLPEALRLLTYPTERSIVERAAEMIERSPVVTA